MRAPHGRRPTPAPRHRGRSPCRRQRVAPGHCPVIGERAHVRDVLRANRLPGALSAVTSSNSRSCASGGRYTIRPSAIQAVGPLGQIPCRVRHSASHRAGRSPPCGDRRPGFAEFGQRTRLEPHDPGLVDLEHDGVGRPGQPVCAGVEARGQDDRLPDAGRGGVEEEVVKEPGRTAICSRRRCSLNVGSSSAMGTSPSSSRVKKSWPTARTSGSANRSLIKGCGPREASARPAATIVAVAPTLDARSQLSPWLRAEPSSRHRHQPTITADFSRVNSTTSSWP